MEGATTVAVENPAELMDRLWETLDKARAALEELPPGSPAALAVAALAVEIDATISRFEDVLDANIAEEALRDVEEHGTVSWEEVKANFDL